MVDYNQAEDWQLVELSRDDPHFFKYIVERYESRLFGYLRRMSYYSSEDIEDMLQEIFLKVYRNLNDFAPRDNFSSLIYRIAHNHLVDCIRKSNCRIEKDTLRSDEALLLAKSGINLEKEARERDMEEKIKAAIHDLPANYREVLILKFLEDKTIEDISDILQRPLGTVATLLRRGREKLKNNLIEKGITSKI